MPTADDTHTLLAAAIDAARGLAAVDVIDLPIEAQAAWARMTRPVLGALVDACGGCPLTSSDVDRQIVEWVLSALEEAATVGERNRDGALTWMLLRLRELMPDPTAT